jgi:predicted nucleic acid-binding protein
MSVVVTDTSPINYLVQIGQVELLAKLFGTVIVPQAVLEELQRPQAPAKVSHWAADLPDWVDIRRFDGPKPDYSLDDGETEAIALALHLQVKAVLMDERKGRRVAKEQGLTTIGTLTLLELGDARGLLEYESVLEKLRSTNFHAGEKLLAASLERVKAERARKASEQ